MNLNADIVFDNLPSEMNARMAGSKVLDLALRRPELYEGGGAIFEADRLYLVNSDRMPQRFSNFSRCGASPRQIRRTLSSMTGSSGRWSALHT